MKREPVDGALAALAIASLAAAIVSALTSPSDAAAPSPVSGAGMLAKFTAAWDKVDSYSCSLTAHEMLGTHVQDRAYDLIYRKPSDTKLVVTGGDGKGGAAVWHGGDTVRGHQGGFFSFIKLTLNIHDSRATSIRGTTIAQANFGAILEHLESLKATIGVAAAGDSTDVDFAVADPSGDQNVTKERVVLASDDLPTEYDEWEGDTLVRHVVYTDVVLNPPLTDASFNL